MFLQVDTSSRWKRGVGIEEVAWDGSKHLNLFPVFTRNIISAHMQVQSLGNTATPIAVTRVTCARLWSKSVSELASWLQALDCGPCCGCEGISNYLNTNHLLNYEELNRLQSLRQMSFLFCDSHSVEMSTGMKLYSCKHYIFSKGNYSKKAEPTN